MIAQAFLDVWSLVMFFKFSNCTSRRTSKTSLMPIYHEMNSRSYGLESRRDIFRASTHIVLKFRRHLEFFGQWKTGERKKVLPRG